MNVFQAIPFPIPKLILWFCCALLTSQACFAGEVLVIGNNAVDRIFYVDHAYDDTGKRLASQMEVFYGGQAANVAYTLGALGCHNVSYIGPFGSDSDAQNGRKALETVGVKTEGVTIDCYSNTANIIVERETGERYITFFPSIEMHTKNHPGYEQFLQGLSQRDFSQVDYVFSDCRVYDLSKVVLQKATEAHVPVVLDMEVASEENRDLLKYATHLVTNACVIEELGQDDNLNTALQTVANQFNLTVVVATLGSEGCIATTRTKSGETGEPFCIDGVSVEVKDTTGAGDAFHAAFILGLAQNLPLEEVLCFANLLAAEKCKYYGPRTPDLKPIAFQGAGL